MHQINAEVFNINDGAGSLISAHDQTTACRPVKTVDQIKYSGSHIEIFGPLPSIHRAVYVIESAKPYLFISGATLKISPATRQGTPEEPIVQAQLDILGAIQINGAGTMRWCIPP
ncbi:hypothetical protein [Bradyrhizobium lablabi]|uniref:hypothetical protein n=1 Tax=Bradyrhizobium lablabi TaxID=722472 RepID=UPI0009A8E231|nr:hypothetical protein [Bradyrhizobium lablabi]